MVQDIRISQTDTGITLRAIEMEADCILLAKAIDGVYDSDPKVNPDAKKFDTISIQEVIDRKLAVVDLTASIMCMEHKMPMAVFSLNEADGIAMLCRVVLMEPLLQLGNRVKIITEK